MRKARSSSVVGGNNAGIKKNDIENFLGFKPSIEACQLTWVDYPIPGVTYSEKDGSCFRYRFNKAHDKDKKPSRIQPVTVCSENLISTDNKTTLAQAQNMLKENQNAQELSNYRRKNLSSPQDSLTNDGAISSGSEGFCEPERSSSLFRDSDSGSEMKEVNSRSNSIDDQDMTNFAKELFMASNFRMNNPRTGASFSIAPQNVNDMADAATGAHNLDIGMFGSEPGERQQIEECAMAKENSSESQHSGDEYQIYYYTQPKMGEGDKKKDKGDEPNFFAGVRTSDTMQDVSKMICSNSMCVVHVFIILFRLLRNVVLTKCLSPIQAVSPIFFYCTLSLLSVSISYALSC